ncbi:MAG: hypothetical protein ACLR1T_16260 [Evtepia gabavorous]
MARFEKGEVKVLCACDLLNEGWDCPATEVLFMASTYHVQGALYPAAGPRHAAVPR